MLLPVSTSLFVTGGFFAAVTAGITFVAMEPETQCFWILGEYATTNHNIRTEKKLPCRPMAPPVPLHPLSPWILRLQYMSKTSKLQYFQGKKITLPANILPCFSSHFWSDLHSFVTKSASLRCFVHFRMKEKSQCSF